MNTVADLKKILEKFDDDMIITVNGSIVWGFSTQKSAYSDKPFLNLERED